MINYCQAIQTAVFYEKTLSLIFTCFKTSEGLLSIYLYSVSITSHTDKGYTVKYNYHSLGSNYTEMCLLLKVTAPNSLC